MIYISSFGGKKVICCVSASIFWNGSRADVNLLSPLSAVALFPFRTSCSRTQTRDTASSSLPSTISRLCKPSICCYGIVLKKKKRNKEEEDWEKAARQLICRLLFPSDFEDFNIFDDYFSFFFAPLPFYMQKHFFGSTEDVRRYITTQMCDMKKTNSIFKKWQYRCNYNVVQLITECIFCLLLLKS